MTGNNINSLFGKSQIRPRRHNSNLIGGQHPFSQWFLVNRHLRIVRGADIKVEILERRGAHPGRLGHAGSRVTQHNPFGIGHAMLQVHRLPHAFLQEIHLRGGHIGVRVRIR